MKKENISEIIDNISPEYIDEAALYTGKARKRRYSSVKYGAAAACLAVLIGGAAALPSVLRNFSYPFLKDNTGSGPDSPSADKSAFIENTSDPLKWDEMTALAQHTSGYKDVVSEGVARLWRWEERTVYEQYTAMKLYGKQFSSRGKEIGEELLGDTLGSYEISGYDRYTEQTYYQTAEVREIKGVSDDLMAAVDLGGKYYIFKNDEYAPPSKFGKLLDSYSLADAVELHRFATCEGFTETGYYELENDDMIWQILAECRNAAFVEKDHWDYREENGISFTVTSEALGVYKNVLLITDSGYLWTNIFDFGYSYFIGEEAAGRIISYATENAAGASFEHYTNMIAGTLTRICDGYFIVDDSILCGDPNDGMEFKVPTDDLRVSRYVDSGEIKLGDLIRIEFTGDIDINDSNRITKIYSISRATLYDGNILVEE